MADNKVNEATWNLTESLRETNQAIVESAVEAQKRNLAFAQNTFENGVELLKSHADSTRNLISEQSGKSQKQAADFQTWADSAIAAQERNVRYAQSIVQNGTDVLKSHVDSTRSLLQTLAEDRGSWQALRPDAPAPVGAPRARATRSSDLPTRARAARGS